jgi:hypothetical protein
MYGENFKISPWKLINEIENIIGGGIKSRWITPLSTFNIIIWQLKVISIELNGNLIFELHCWMVIESDQQLIT